MVGQVGDRMRRCAGMGLVVALAACSGCQQIGALIAVMSGGENDEADYKLTQGPLAVVVDDPEQFGVPPDAIQAFHEKLVQQFDEYKVNKRVIPLSEVNRLKQNDPKYED